MALKSVLEVGVEDSAFREFSNRFQRYQEAVKASSGAWAEVAKGTGGAAATFDAMVKKAEAQALSARLNALASQRAAEVMRKADLEAIGRMGRLRKETEAWGSAVAKVAGQWKTVAVYSAKSGVNLASATVSLLKWTSALGVASALLGGAGGLFGVDRLAQAAAAMRRQSMTTGASIGRSSAFDLNYSRFGDTGSIVGNVATAKSDMTSRQFLGLLGAGISVDDIRRKDAADLGVQLFDRLPQLFRRGADDPLLGPQAEARSLTSLMSIDDIKKYLRASPEERQQQRDAYGKDQASFSIDEPVGRGWQDLVTQLDRAKGSIEATFITGLVPLAGPIGDASKAFTDLTAAFLKSGLVKDGIEGLAGGLETAAKYVSTQEFKDDVKSFVDNVGVLAGKIKTALEWLGLIPTKAQANSVDPKGDHDVAAGTVGGGGTVGPIGPGGTGPGSTGDGASLRNRRPHDAHAPTDFAKRDARLAAFRGGNAGQSGWWTPERQSHAVDRLMAEGGLTETAAKAAVARMMYVEAPGGPTSVNPSSGAEGIAQWLDRKGNGSRGTFDEQLTKYIGELNGSEGRAKRIFNTPGREAEGASAFERAEHYGRGNNPGTNAGTDRDDYTDRTAKMMGSIVHSAEASKRYAAGTAGAPAAPATPAEKGAVGQPPPTSAMSPEEVRNAEAWIHSLGIDHPLTQTEHDKLGPLQKRLDAYYASRPAAGPMVRPSVSGPAPKSGPEISPEGRRQRDIDGAAATARHGKPLPSWMAKDLDGGEPWRVTDFRNVDRLRAEQGQLRAERDEARRHLENARLVMRAHFGDLAPYAHEDFRAKVRAARGRALEERGREEGRGDAAGPQRTSGLNSSRFQTRARPKIEVANNTGANVNITATMAAATVGYG